MEGRSTMLIRSEQMAVMEQYAEGAFESEMAGHIREFAPARAESIGDECLRTVVRTGLFKARGHGFTCRGPLRLYLDLMCLFGSDFDTDPQCRWATEILSDPELGIEMQRATRLYERAMEFMNEIAGPGGDLLALGLAANRRDAAESIPVGGRRALGSGRAMSYLPGEGQADG